MYRNINFVFDVYYIMKIILLVETNDLFWSNNDTNVRSYVCNITDCMKKEKSFFFVSRCTHAQPIRLQNNMTSNHSQDIRLHGIKNLKNVKKEENSHFLVN